DAQVDGGRSARAGHGLRHAAGDRVPAAPAGRQPGDATGVLRGQVHPRGPGRRAGAGRRAPHPPPGRAGGGAAVL
ncbi:MAG: hypothetical protein AVDCRST_MAG64-2572, partial [uncultured Phycisphaerae bacterium]